MNKTPNPNYPLPEKWYVQRTIENARKVNDLCGQILEVLLTLGNSPYDHNNPSFTSYIHSVFSVSKTKCFQEPQEGYTKVTYEDLWLAYVIPENWYCVDTPVTLLNRLRRLNGLKDLRSNYKPIILSEPRTNNSYYWGGTLSGLKRTEYYNDYKEISLEDLTTLLDILEQKKNTKPMENNKPNEVIIPITEFTKIVEVACPAWQKKLRDYMIDNLQNNCFSIKITKDFYDKMIEASTVRDGINQAAVINSVLPMFKPDPYQVFKDAKKEGRIVQYKDFYGVWVDGNWSYLQPPERYRIKHKHQDLIDKWESSGRTKKVQFLDFSTEGKWLDLENNAIIWDEISEYRFKPETEYVPFTFKDCELFLGKTIVSKDGNCISMITYCSIDNSVHIGRTKIDLEYVFDQYTFLDGSPCGRLVTE